MTITNDEIIDEIRHRRETHAAALGYDLKKIVRDLQQQERQHDVRVLIRPPRRPVPASNPVLTGRDHER